MKNKELRESYDKAVNAWAAADLALQAFGSHIVFEEFKPFDEPTIGFVCEDCIAITYNGLEIDGKDAIKIMEDKGCITPNDF